MEVKIKEWKLIPAAQKDNLEYMQELIKLYEENVDNYQTNEDYVKAANQAYKLQQRRERALAEELKKLEAEKKKQESTLRRRTSDLNLQELIDKFNFYMTSTGSLAWYYQPEFEDEYGNRDWRQLKKETLQANFAATDVYIRGEAGEPDYSSFKEFNKMLVDQGRIFTSVVQSYDEKKAAGKLNIMNRNFALPAADGRTDYHWFIDALFQSISGGEPGDEFTFEHLQQIIYSKYIHPGNIFLPNVFINDSGSSGKGLFGSRFLKTLFSGSIADNCNIEHLTGKFNGVIAGKAIIYINETARAKVAVEKVKAFLGSPTFKVENKFETPYDCDNTALVVSVTNEKAGGITLSGENSDRRYSIFSTRSDIYKTVIAYMTAREGRTMTRDEAQNWIEDTGQYILSDREEIGRWINAMVAKHGDLKHVRANLDSDAYKTLLERQRPAWTRTVEEVFNEKGFVYIRDHLLRELVREYNRGEHFLPGRNTFQEEVERLCRDKGIQVSLVQRCTINGVHKSSVQRTCWVKHDDNNVVATVNEDESAYGEYDDRGRWVWKWTA